MTREARSQTERFADVRFGDLFTLLSVHRNASVTAAARELRVTPSQVSKAIRRLEEQLHLKLLARNSRGVALSDAGRRVLPHVQDAVARLQEIGQHRTERGIDLTLAAPSWLAQLALPSIAVSVPNMRLRGLELPPALLRAYAAEGYFEVALVTSDVDRFPGLWVSTQVGVVRKALFGTAKLAAQLGPEPIPEAKLRDVLFVSPVLHTNGQFVLIDDDCPLGHSARTVGHQAQTMSVALEVAAATDQLVFGPAVTARRYVESGALQEIRVEGWNVTEPVFLVCNGDRVLARVQEAIIKGLQDVFQKETKRRTS